MASKSVLGRGVLILGAGLIAISFASIFIKLCEAPSVVIAFYRLAIASTFYWGISRIKYGAILPAFTRQNKKLAILSGIFLAAHFAFWITSLSYTSVASSVVLVQTAPIFVVFGGYIFLKEKPNRTMIIGITTALAGTIVISAFDYHSQQSSLFGNLLSLGGAVSAAGYLLFGRKLRAQIDTFRYVTIVYSVAAVATLLLVVFYRNSLINYPPQTFILFVAIAMIPQVIGHTSLNWALKYFSATTVSILTLAEPIGASILALLILGEQLALLKIIGGGIIISGVLMVLVGETRE